MTHIQKRELLPDDRMREIIAESVQNLQRKATTPVKEEPPVIKRKCKGCSLTLDITSFYKSGRGKHTSRCKTCWRQRYGK